MMGNGSFVMYPLTEPGLVAAWRVLAADPINDGVSGERVVARDTLTGEVWQYMGTINGGHTFRHRRHPNVGRRVVRVIAAV